MNLIALFTLIVLVIANCLENVSISVKQANELTLDEFLNDEFSPVGFNGTWISGK